jgi:hypothetical protein
MRAALLLPVGRARITFCIYYAFIRAKKLSATARADIYYHGRLSHTHINITYKRAVDNKMHISN